MSGWRNGAAPQDLLHFFEKLFWKRNLWKSKSFIICFTRLSVCLSVRLSIRLTACLPACLYACLPNSYVCLSISLSLCLLVCLPTCQNLLSFYLSVCISSRRSVCLYLRPICVSVCLPICGLRVKNISHLFIAIRTLKVFNLNSLISVYLESKGHNLGLDF